MCFVKLPCTNCLSNCRAIDKAYKCMRIYMTAPKQTVAILCVDAL